MFPNTEGIPVWMFEMEVTGSQSQIVGVSSCSSVLCGAVRSVVWLKAKHGAREKRGQRRFLGMCSASRPQRCRCQVREPIRTNFDRTTPAPSSKGRNVCSNLISCLRMVQGGFSMVQVQMLQMISLFHLHTHLHGANSRFMYWSGPQPIGYVTCITTFHESCICTYTMNC